MHSAKNTMVVGFLKSLSLTMVPPRTRPIDNTLIRVPTRAPILRTHKAYDRRTHDSWSARWRHRCASELGRELVDLCFDLSHSWPDDPSHLLAVQEEEEGRSSSAGQVLEDGHRVRRRPRESKR